MIERRRSLPADHLSVVALVAGLAVMAAMAAPMLTGRAILRDDLASFHLPLRYLYAQALENGQSLLWFPQVYAGFYVHGEGQLGMLHPLHLLLYRVLPLIMAFNVELLLNYVALFAGTWLFLRRQALPAAAALAGALVFTFSGFNMMHFVHPNMIGVVAHMPWLLAAIDVVLRETDGRRVAWAQLAIGLLTASQVLLGHPQAMWLSAFLEVLYVLWLARSWQTHRRVWAVALAKVLGVAAGAVQLLPTWEAVSDSTRADPSLSFRYRHALDPANLVQLVSPYLPRARAFGTLYPHEAVLYCGALGSLAPLWLLIRGHRPACRRLTNAVFMLTALSIVLALGEVAYLYRVQANLPLIGTFENAGRYVVWLQLALAVGAALVVRDLIELRERRERVPPPRLWLLSLAPAASVLAMAGAAWLRAHPQVAPDLARQLSGAVAALTGAGLMAVAAGLVAAAASGVRLALPALVLFVAFDQGFYGLSYLRSQYSPASVDEFANAQAHPPEASTYRVQADNNMLVMNGARVAGGYAAFLPTRLLDHLDGQRLRAAGVKWVQTKAPWQATGADTSLLPNWEGRVRGRITTRDALGGEAYWSEVIDPMPRAWLVSRARVSADPGRDIGSIDLASTALVSQAIALEAAAPDAPPGRVEVGSDDPGLVRLSTTAASRQLLIVSESWHHGWQVRVDGIEQPVVRVFGDFIGSVVEPGRHRVEFRFRPWSFRAGAWLSLLGFSLMLVMFAGTRRAMLRRAHDLH